MPPPQAVFTPLELAVLEAICRAPPVDRTALEAQLSTAAFRSRENAGGGFYTRFGVDQDSSTQISGVQLKNGPPG